MTVKEASILYEISEVSIRKWCKSGRIKAEKINNTWNVLDGKEILFIKDFYFEKQLCKVGWNRHVFEKIDTPEKAYWLGFITADGCIHETNNCLSINIGGKDEELLEKFSTFVEAQQPIIQHTTHSITGNDLCNIQLCSETNIKFLEELGLTPRKSGKEKFIYTNFNRDFIRGVFDGDGCISSQRMSVDLVGSYGLLTAVQKYFYEVLDVKPHKIFDHCSIYRIYYHSKTDVKKICSHLWQDGDCCLERKFKIAKEIEKIC